MKGIAVMLVLSHTADFPNWHWLEPDRRLKFLFAPGSRKGGYMCPMRGKT